MARSFQEWVHWIELGAGAAWIRRMATMLAVVLVSLWIGYTQFRGPRSEVTLAQAVVGRQIATGQGYTTLVNYPQTAAHLQARGIRWGAAAFPEMHLAPGYPTAIAGLFKLVPESYRAAMFDVEPNPPNGTLPDYLLLALNVVLFWIGIAQTYWLGKALFDRVIAVVAAGGVALCAPLWQQIVAVNGTPLSMVLALAVLQVCVLIEERSARGRLPKLSLAAAGALSALLALTDYAAAAVILPVVIYVWIRFSGERVSALVPLLGAFLIPLVAWGSWMTGSTGSPVGFAWQEIALKTDGTAADPAIVRTTLTSTVPGFSLAKFGNKGLTQVKVMFERSLWSGGAMLFAAFFVAGFLYEFVQRRTQAMRVLFAGMLLALVLSNAFFSSGEGERDPTFYLAPGIILFGAGFAAVLVSSNHRLASHLKWAFAALVALQAVPLLKDGLEPRRLHFHYPPYYPTLFIGMRDEMLRRGGPNPGWMADVPAGAAWYSGLRVWAQPANLHDFYAIGVEQPMIALVLTPHTLDKPYFSELAHRTGTSRLGEWAEVYAGLATNRLPGSFALSLPQKVSDNLYVLIDPTAQPYRRRSK